MSWAELFNDWIFVHRIVFDKDYVGEWVAKQLGCKWIVHAQCIGLERNGELIAGVIYENYNGFSLNFHVVFKGRLTRRFLWVIFHYPFIQLGVYKLIGFVESTNENCTRLDKKMGFVLEHSIKGAGRNCDINVYTMTKDQCKFLEIADAI